MEIQIIDQKNKNLETRTLKLRKEIDKSNSYEYLAHMFNRYVNNRFRFSNASTKGRSEIVMTGAKGYRQKGTGNARRGRNSTPLRRGGAVAFGPKPRSFNFKLNKKTIKLSQELILNKISNKVKIISNKVTFTKTKDAMQFLSHFKAEKIILLITHDDIDFIKPFRNIKTLLIDYADYFEPETLLVHDIVLFTENSFASFERNTK
ncbi:50S ribosomal protein L4 [Candidatus Marinamargulisbacteria bacterium SCGC AG-333-B06]|nr:50S ribosomal protein L4 [Candidatus Marinamargulisbacteria bacterium SCGC AG-333-B06]